MAAPTPFRLPKLHRVASYSPIFPPDRRRIEGRFGERRLKNRVAGYKRFRSRLIQCRTDFTNIRGRMLVRGIVHEQSALSQDEGNEGNQRQALHVADVRVIHARIITVRRAEINRAECGVDRPAD